MSGHSKWSTIKHKKARTDAKRGKIFTKLLREITIASRLGGGDRDGNPRLRAAIQDAKGSNVPSDNIDRAVKKGSGELGGAILEEVNYEGYAPGGVAVLVEAATDNRNRTTGEVRHLFTRFGGSLGEAGCVNWMFDRRGYFLLGGEMTEDALMELALELGVDDFAADGYRFELFTAMEDYIRVRQELEQRGVELEVKELSMIPQSYIELDEEGLSGVIKLLDALEDQEDVQHVWANFDADEALLAGS
ncbi:MAG: YebC/PmpR family DNA-binding transcriptional regulator [Acidobacteriota bacterium]|nr:YebC/PmpR family DNA-binding transcriptional regulator [Acidobacteriota bacterium]